MSTSPTPQTATAAPNNPGNNPPAANSSGAGVTSARARVSQFIAANGALVGLVIVCILMCFASPNFLSSQNLLNVGVQAAVTAILGFGMTFVIITSGIDLSVGSVAGLSAICAGWAVASAGLPGGLALIVAPLAGLVAGAVSGLAVAYIKLPAFIATLAMLSIARGLALVFSGGLPIAMPDAVNALGGNLGPIPVPIIVMAVVGLVTSFVLNRTVFGRSLYAIGGNEEAARLAGLPVKRTLATVYALCGMFAGIAGVVLAGRLSSAQPQAATGYELDAIAAVVIGGASLAGGVGRAFGTFIGALVLAVIRNGLNLLNINAFWQQVVIGLVIALAVAIDSLRNRNT